MDYHAANIRFVVPSDCEVLSHTLVELYAIVVDCWIVDPESHDYRRHFASLIGKVVEADFDDDDGDAAVIRLAQALDEAGTRYVGRWSRRGDRPGGYVIGTGLTPGIQRTLDEASADANIDGNTLRAAGCTAAEVETAYVLTPPGHEKLRML